MAGNFRKNPGNVPDLALVMIGMDNNCKKLTGCVDLDPQWDVDRDGR